MITKQTAISEVFEKSGNKLTKSRGLVIDVLLNSTTHIKAEQIYEILFREGIGLATIYRTLELLESLNLVECICFEGVKYYREKRERRHIHFVCEICHNIIEYEDDKIESSLADQEQYLALKFGHEVKSGYTIVRGICEKCKMH